MIFSSIRSKLPSIAGSAIMSIFITMLLSEDEPLTSFVITYTISLILLSLMWAVVIFLEVRKHRREQELAQLSDRIVHWRYDGEQVSFSVQPGHRQVGEMVSVTMTTAQENPEWFNDSPLSNAPTIPVKIADKIDEEINLPATRKLRE
jgi:hypothetical protein